VGVGVKVDEGTGVGVEEGEGLKVGRGEGVEEECAEGWESEDEMVGGIGVVEDTWQEVIRNKTRNIGTQDNRLIADSRQCDIKYMGRAIIRPVWTL
jgi:hypothetical protein